MSALLVPLLSLTLLSAAPAKTKTASSPSATRPANPQAAPSAAPEATPAPRAPSRPAPETFAHPVNINAERLQVHGKKNEAVWSGHVVADRETTHLTCDRLVAHYDDRQEITRLECVGDVEVTDGNKWARGARADFDNVSGVLVVTGDPEAREGQNHIRGTKVTFYVGQDLIEVENAKAVFPSKKTLLPPRRKGGS